MRIIRNLSALTLALASQLASAFVDPPVLVTTNPVPGQSVLISIAAGDCDAIAGDPYPPPVITRNGNDVQMLVWTVTSLDPEYCFYPIGAVTLAVGAFLPGSYVLRVDRTYLGGDGYVTVPLGTLAFVVAAPESVPALGLFASMVLITLFLASALAVFHSRPSRVPPDINFEAQR